MATAPQANLPLFYQDLMPLNSRDHANWTSRTIDGAHFLKGQHAIPVTVDEFVECQRSFPIVFSSGDNSLPIALMGLNEGVNTFVDDEGKITDPVYLPAYIRRYPFLLAKLQPDSEELSLCFDPTHDVLGEHEGGQALFDGDAKPTAYTQGILQFCENFEQSGQRTKAFMDEITAADILMDGEIAITENAEPDKPFVYRGFRMIDETKLRELPAEKLDAWNKNGLLMMIHAHMFSLNLMRIIFGRQVQQGTAPKRQEQTVN